MPVFTRVENGILNVIVDGDYTSAELQRVGAAALEAEAGSGPIPTLLDLSGAAGLSARSSESVRETAQFFAAHKELMRRVAIIAPGDLAFGLMRMAGVVAGFGGLETEPFRTKAEALSWLREVLQPGHQEPSEGRPGP